METIIYVAAILIAIISTILAFGAPTTFMHVHQRGSKAAICVALAGFFWLASGDAIAVNTIHRIIQEGQGAAPEATLSTVRTFASEAANEQHVYGPAFFALVAAVIYMEVLARVRAKRANGNAA